MKKLKKLLAAFLAVAAVCSLMVAPASAALYVNSNSSDNGSGQGCHWSSSLNMTDHKVTAQIIVNANSSGVIPAVLTAKVSGKVFTANGARYLLTDDKYGPQSVIASDFKSVSSPDTVIGASCIYYAMGVQAGRELKLGETNN